MVETTTAAGNTIGEICAGMILGAHGTVRPRFVIRMDKGGVLDKVG